MQTYGKYSPTQFDHSGAFLPDQADWLVMPCGRNRDSQPLDESNFDNALELLGGESDDVEVHRFGHWGCGWFELIIVRPGTPAADIAHDIETRLENYPLLNEEDVSQREWDAYLESWDAYACRDFVEELGKEFGFDDCGAAMAYLESADKETLREFYRDHAPHEYETHSDGPHIDTERAANAISREAMAGFLKQLRNKQPA